MKILLFLLTALAALAQSNTGNIAQIVLTWTDNSQSEQGFIIQRAPKPLSGSAPLSTYAEVARVPANTVTWTDTNLPPSTGFSYRVIAFNAAGNSEPSNITTATTAALPAPIAATAAKATPVPIPPQ